MKKIALLGMCLTGFICHSAEAQQSYYLHQPHISTRVMGMGGAYTAVADDYQALYYNPAGLAWLEHSQFVADIEGAASLSPSIVTLANNLSAAGSNATQLQSTMAGVLGNHYASRVGLGGTWVRPHWGIGFQPVDLSVELDINGVEGATVGVQAYQDSTIQYGYGWSWGAKVAGEHREPVENKEMQDKEKAEAEAAFAAADAASKKAPGEVAGGAAGAVDGKPGDLKDAGAKETKPAVVTTKVASEADQNKGPREWSFGIAPKAVYRAYINQSLSALQLATSSNFFQPSYAQEGITFDADLGLLYNMPVPESGLFAWMKYARPTFGLAVLNIIDYGFPQDLHLYSAGSVAATTANGANLQRRFNVGTKFELPEFWVFKPRLMFDARDMGTTYASFNKCFHAGGELLWKAFSWLNGGYRMGLSEGYLTLGVSAELGIFLLDLATYSQNIGTTLYPQESRRYMAQLSLDFNAQIKVLAHKSVCLGAHTRNG